MKISRFFVTLGLVSAKLTPKFSFPDPVRDAETPFCPITPLLNSNAYVLCTKSAFSGSQCVFKCDKNGHELVDESGKQLNAKIRCVCEGFDCEWKGRAVFGKCRDYEKYRLSLEREVNHVVLKKYFKHVITSPVELKISKFSGGVSSKRTKKKAKQITRLVEKKIPKTDAEIDEFIAEGKEHGDTQTIMDIPINVADLEKGLSQDYDGTCKPLNLRFGEVECSDRFQKGSECIHKCQPGYKLHRMSPTSRICMCTKWGCVWMRKAKARCQKMTKGGRKKKKVDWPLCVHIAGGKKVLVLSRQCMCPSGWRNRDKCLSPNIDHTQPCVFDDPYNATDSDRHVNSGLKVELNCAGSKLSWYDEDDRLDGPMVKMIVPGHTTKVNFSSSHVYDLDGFFLEGAYKLHTADFSFNFLKTLPFDLFKRNHVMTAIDLSNNQIKIVPPRLLLGLNLLEEIDFSHNRINSLNKLLFKDCASLRRLDLSHNNILTLTKWNVKNILALEYLDVSHNRLRDLGGMSFEGRNLNYIDLSNNNLDKLQSTVFNHLENVEKINLAFNSLPYLSLAFTNKLEKVKDFDLSHNKFKNMRDEQFKRNKQLKRLFLDHNSLNQFPVDVFGNCSNLSFLDSRNNFIEQLPPALFENCAQLKYAFFGHNKINKLDDDLFLNSPQLRTIDFSWNRLNRVSVPFARRNENMTHIYFHHNNIRSLPSNLIYGSRKLRSADFEFNKLQAVRYVKPEKRVKPKNMHTIDLQRNWRMGRNLNTRFATDDSWYYKVGAVQNPVEDALEAYEKAIEKTDFKGRNDRGRLFNPTVEEMKDHQRERPGKRFSDYDEKDDDIYYDREL